MSLSSPAPLSLPLSFEDYLKTRSHRVEKCLEQHLPMPPEFNIGDPEHPPTQLYKAMRYSVLNGGKRIRPLLVYAAGEALGHPLELLDTPAAALELIHCYSLIHDDLPAMDNDDVRRGKASCHKAFDEATAILAGDGLQSLAFELLSDPLWNPVHPDYQLQMIRMLAQKSGRQGMVGGQALDLAETGKGNTATLSIQRLRAIHHKKTGALIETAVTLGALASKGALSDVQQGIIPKLQEYARCIGLAFQIQDDILDIVGEPETLGKSIGKDQQQNKATFPGKLGIDTAQQYARALHQQALESISCLTGKNCYLRKLSEFFIQRAT